MQSDKDHATARARHHEIDWLVVAATLAVFLFHCARYFDNEGWHVKNPVTSPALSTFVMVTGQWIMPLFFLLSGMSSRHSLRSRGALSFVLDRTRRLGTPFLFNVLVIFIPLQVWIERVSHRDFAGSFIQFYPRYFDGFYAFGGNFAWMGLHLWYLLMLLVFSWLALPVLVLLDAPPARRVLAGLASLCKARGGVLLLALPLCAVELWVNTQPASLGIRAFGGWSPVSYLVVFLLGAVSAQAPAFREGFVKGLPITLPLAVAATCLLFFVPQNLLPAMYHTYPFTTVLRALNSWLWLTSLYGFAARRLAFGPSLLARLRALALPFYILHQTVIVTFGYLIIDWTLPIAGKYTLLAAGSFALTLLLLRPIGAATFLRPFFGMGPAQRSGPGPRRMS